jgi:enoyl-CoA hydratase/carnithine racemase
MAELVRAERKGGVVSVFLNRPERRNAMSMALLDRLGEILANELGEDTCAVIIGSRDDCFSAGADIAELQGTIADLDIDDAIEDVTGRILGLPVPVIAAIDGPCMGGAFDLALSCDYRIASQSAIFQVPAAHLGLLYNPRAVVRMHHRVGRDTLFRMLVLGERLDANQALAAGVVSRVVEGPSFDAAFELAQGTGDHQMPAVAATKQLLNDIDSAGFDGAYDPEKWQERRRRLLSLPGRLAAVSAEKKRRGY